MPDQVAEHILALAHSRIDLASRPKLRLAEAKAWCKVLPSESAAFIARIFDRINPNSLKSSRREDMPSNARLRCSPLAKNALFTP